MTKWIGLKFASRKQLIRAASWFESNNIAYEMSPFQGLIVEQSAFKSTDDFPCSGYTEFSVKSAGEISSQKLNEIKSATKAKAPKTAKEALELLKTI